MVVDNEWGLTSADATAEAAKSKLKARVSCRMEYILGSFGVAAWRAVFGVVALEGDDGMTS
jgi:hypothetical protein